MIIPRDSTDYVFSLKMVSIVSVTPLLTYEDIAKLGKDIKDEYYLWDEEDFDPETLDLVIMDVLINDKHHTVYHAFPGDNPVGIFKSNLETSVFGEGCNVEPTSEAGKLFVSWYNNITKDMTDYSNFPNHGPVSQV